jgi:hypothetical protein
LVGHRGRCTAKSNEIAAYAVYRSKGVEIWFSKIQQDLIARGIFCSVKDLDRKVMRYIRSYNRKATPIKWSYKDASNRTGGQSPALAEGVFSAAMIPLSSSSN